MSGVPDRVSGWTEVAWSRFRALPTWVQVVGWLLAWWLLIPVLAWKTTWAVTPKLIVTGVTFALFAGLVATQDDPGAPAPSPTLAPIEPTTSPAQDPSLVSDTPSPTSSPSPVEDPLVAVPDVVSVKLARAKSALSEAGFSAEVRRRVSDEPPGTVLSQRPRAGKRLEEGETVRLVVAKAAPEPPTGVYGNPWGYNFDCCSLIYEPPSDFCSYFPCIGNFWNGRGHVIQCRDEMFSKSGGISGSCSYHGGNLRPLYAP